MGNTVSYAAKEHIVDLGSKGKVKGLQLDDKACRYAGLPYALPPTGEHRWRRPRPLPPAHTYTRPDGEPYDATAFRPPCAQDQEPLARAGFSVPATARGPDAFNEDCLVVNIWTPVRKTGTKWPVMIWLHGGWFQMGNACQDADADPTELISTAGLDAIVVAVGYRLNVFGFLATRALVEESGGEAAGNFGLWDQRLAMEWVHDNIGRFGGDVGNVTLAGRSAGAYSVEAQLLHDFRRQQAPATGRTLFHRLFMSSNAIPAQPRTVAEAEPQFDEVCEYFKIPLSLVGGEKLARLRQLRAEQLVQALRQLAHHTFRPVTDDLFFHAGMLAYFQDASLATEFKRRGLRLLIGEVRNEETLYAQYRSPEQGTPAALLRQTANYYAPAAAARILQQYAMPTTTDVAAWKALLGRILADGQVRASTRFLVHQLQAHGVAAADIWRYRIDYRLSCIDERVAPMSLGVAHGMDGPLWSYAMAQGPTPDERALMDAWIANLVAFVRADAGFDFGTRAVDEVKVVTPRRTVEVQRDAGYDELRRLGEVFARGDGE